jgi:hypothetical protein
MRILCRVYGLYILLISIPTLASDYRIGPGIGVFDVFDHANTLTGSLSIEGSPIPTWWDMRPTVQLLAIDEDGYYLGLGLLKEFPIEPDWSWGVAFSAGAAHESSETKALQYDLEFYSRIFLSHSLNKKNDLRLELGHISNSGLDDKNPGTEPLMLFWIHHF